MNRLEHGNWRKMTVIRNSAALLSRITVKSKHSQESQPKKCRGRERSNDGHAQCEIENQPHNMSILP
jgi:hypothetical protein